MAGKKRPEVVTGGSYGKGNPSGIGSGIPPEKTPLAIATDMLREAREAYAERDALREDLRDRMAIAIAAAMVTHGTHHTPERVMRMAYEFADQGMVVREAATAEPEGK